MVAGECVASWASNESRGLKAGGCDFPQEIILGVYGGKITKEKGPYVLDVTLRGGENRTVDPVFQDFVLSLDKLSVSDFFKHQIS